MTLGIFGTAINRLTGCNAIKHSAGAPTHSLSDSHTEQRVFSQQILGGDTVQTTGWMENHILVFLITQHWLHQRKPNTTDDVTVSAALLYSCYTKLNLFLRSSKILQQKQGFIGVCRVDRTTGAKREQQKKNTTSFICIEHTMFIPNNALVLISLPDVPGYCVTRKGRQNSQQASIWD